MITTKLDGLQLALARLYSRRIRHPSREEEGRRDGGEKGKEIARAIEGGRKTEKGHGNTMRKRTAKRRRRGRRRKRCLYAYMRALVARTHRRGHKRICERVPAQPAADALAERSCPPTSGSHPFPRFFFLLPLPLWPFRPHPLRPSRGRTGAGVRHTKEIAVRRLHFVSR